MPCRPDRRSVLSAGLALPFAHGLAQASAGGARAPKSGKRLLVLGGTRFLGPQIVRAALDEGWDVTLFNRGRSNPDLFPELELRKGDRDTGDLASLTEGEWDAVVDTSGYVPDHVRQTAELLADRARHYVFVSTISVYADFGAETIDENAPLSEISAEDLEGTRTIGDSFREPGLYGPLKALCEQAAETAMPGRVTNLRPGLIVGPEDGSDRFTYWCERVRRGGDVLAPDVPGAEVQFVDVRDLGAFCFRVGCERNAGVMNAVGFPFEVLFPEVLHGAKIAIGSDARFVFVDERWLLDRGVQPWMELPLWLPPDMRGHFDNTRALEAGLTCRPIGDTIEATLAWHLDEHGEDYEWRRAGMRVERERDLLAAWRARDAVPIDEGAVDEVETESGAPR